jgi:hypothetical protein
MAEPELTFTDADGQDMHLYLLDADGQRMHFYMLKNGGAILHWPSGDRLHFTRKQFDKFMKKLGVATRQGKALTINVNEWMH